MIISQGHQERSGRLTCTQKASFKISSGPPCQHGIPSYWNGSFE